MRNAKIDMTNRLLIKVCGMRDEENIQQVAALGVDFLGEIFYRKSPRFVSTPPTVVTSTPIVGVFVNASIEDITLLAESHKLSYIQLHGDETPQYVTQLRTRLPETGMIKALSVYNEEDVFRWRNYEGLVDYFLFDTKCNSVGGSGHHFDWDILQGYDGDTPFFLSGGIGLDDVEALKSFRHPRLAGYDLNSKFEISPALKDVEMLKAFLSRISE